MKNDHAHSHEGGHQCCGHDHAHEAEKCTQEHMHTSECSHGHEHAHEHVHSDKCSHGHEHVHGPHCTHDHHHDHDHDHEDAEWTRRFFLALQAVVLLMIGGVLCYFVASNRIDNYLVGGFRVMALCGGIGIIILGLFNLLMRNKHAGCCHEHEEEEGGTSPHTHDGSVVGRAITLLLLSGSIAAAAVLTPDRYTTDFLRSKADVNQRSGGDAQRLKKDNPGLANALSQGGGLTLERLEKAGLRKSKEGNYVLSVMDLHYMPSDIEYARIMAGQNVEVTGQLMKDTSNQEPGHMRLFVVQVTCCAADSQPYSIPVLFTFGDPEFVDAGWYVVPGKVEIIEENGMKASRIKATQKPTPTLRPPDQRTGF